MNSNNIVKRCIATVAALSLLAGMTSCRSVDTSTDTGYATATPTPHHAAPVQNSSSSIEIGDRLDLMVMEDIAFNGQYVVRDSGDIIVPKIGRVNVAGRSVQSAQESVRSKVETEQIKNPTVILDRVARRSQRSFDEKDKLLVFLTGAVRRPGQHFVAMDNRSGLTAYEAVLIGGGPNPYADSRRAYILRKIGNGQRERIPVDLRAISQGYDVDPQITEGDILYIPERRFGL
ncbi:MAG: polysaccharide biosynthesis/export family protein [Verrucomicrobiaceae bacterium]|nr:polysaccharide biosynthesis/export family protein [Verrucomicrobiaceae bacterium]